MSNLFKITEIELPAQPVTKLEPSISIDKNLSVGNTNCESSNKLYISEKAKSQIFEHIDWSKSTDSNSVEQGGLLLGCTYFDENQKIFFGMVELAIPALTAIGSMAYLKFDHNTWKRMLDQVDEILDERGNENLHVIGWYHTHPNDLGVFMSGTDRNTQKKMFNQEWQYAIVLNPHKQVWKVFNGADAQECYGYIICDEEPYE